MIGIKYRRGPVNEQTLAEDYRISAVEEETLAPKS